METLWENSSTHKFNATTTTNYYMFVAVTSREGNAIHTMMRTDMLETKKKGGTSRPKERSESDPHRSGKTKHANVAAYNTYNTYQIKTARKGGTSCRGERSEHDLHKSG